MKSLLIALLWPLMAGAQTSATGGIIQPGGPHLLDDTNPKSWVAATRDCLHLVEKTPHGAPETSKRDDGLNLCLENLLKGNWKSQSRGQDCLRMARALSRNEMRADRIRSCQDHFGDEICLGESSEKDLCRRPADPLPPVGPFEKSPSGLTR